ncbi:hypothetical protein [Microbacterium hominis]|uniref:hypothetical protein n=1 Tax=Microbacterium hominis TaxID=162426 RepID=UPI00168B6AE2|nr:hypothetical protein [Microbacterium hominis]QOC24686.1 hypothetical protein IC745_09815 [Microbacterium hominis]
MTALRRTPWAVALLGAVALFTLLPIAGLGARADDGVDDSGNVSVTVVDGSTPSPSPSSTASPRPTTPPAPGSSSTSGGSGGGGSGGGASGGSAPAGTGAADDVSIAGMVYIGGINSSVALSPDPGSGEVTLWLTVRNASTRTIDLTVDFWMESVLFGVPLDQTRGVAVPALQPAEVRVVSTRLHGAGQWGLVDTHATVTPPATVDGTALTPVTRDALVFVFPWVSVLVAAVIVIGLLAWRAVALALAAEPPAEAAA